MLVYLAGPIDMAGTDVRPLHAQAETELGARRVAFFDPSTAYGAAQHDPVMVRNSNERAIADASGVLALMPAGVQTVGTPMEILSAWQRGKPVVVVGCTRSMQLRAMHIPAYPEDQLGEAIDQLVVRMRTPSLYRVGGSIISSPPQMLQNTGPLTNQIRDQLVNDPYTARQPILWKGNPEWKPYRKYPGDAGYDLFCDADVTVPAGDFIDVSCGVSVALPPGVWGMITGRSSTLRRRGLLVHTGIIDQGYRGPLFAGVFNLSDVDRAVRRGDRLAQMIPLPLTAARVEFKIVDELPEADRGSSGFGSTGH